jgi:hypothetical protein
LRSMMKPGTGNQRNKDEDKNTEQINTSIIEDHLKELMSSLAEMKVENLKRHEENLRRHQETNEKMDHMYQHLDEKISDVQKEMRQRLDIVEERVESRRSSRNPSPPREDPEETSLRGELSNLGLRDRSVGARLPPSLREGEQKSSRHVICMRCNVSSLVCVLVDNDPQTTCKSPNGCNPRFSDTSPKGNDDMVT